MNLDVVRLIHLWQILYSHLTNNQKRSSQSSTQNWDQLMWTNQISRHKRLINNRSILVHTHQKRISSKNLHNSNNNQSNTQQWTTITQVLCNLLILILYKKYITELLLNLNRYSRTNTHQMLVAGIHPILLTDHKTIPNRHKKKTCNQK